MARRKRAAQERRSRAFHPAGKGALNVRGRKVTSRSLDLLGDLGDRRAGRGKYGAQGINAGHARRRVRQNKRFAKQYGKQVRSEAQARTGRGRKARGVRADFAKAYRNPRTTAAKRKVGMGVGAAALAGAAVSSAGRSRAGKKVRKSFANRHPTTIGAQKLTGSASRKVGKKHFVNVNYSVEREPSLVKLNKKGRNTLKGQPVGRSRMGGTHHSGKQPRDARGRFARRS